MTRFRFTGSRGMPEWLLAAGLLLAACGGSDHGSNSGSELVAPPTRTPASTEAATVEVGDDASLRDTTAPAHLEPTSIGNGSALALAWVDGGTRLAVTGSRGLWTYSEMTSGSPAPPGPERASVPWSGTPAFSPDGTLVVAAKADGSAGLWRYGADDWLFPLAEPGTRLERVTFSADSAAIAAVTIPPDTSERGPYAAYTGLLPAGAAIRVWDTASGESNAYEPPDDRVLGIGFDAQGRVIVAGSANNVPTYEPGAPGTEPRKVPAPSDDFDVRLWALGSGDEPLATITGEEWAIESVTFSPDAALVTAPVVAVTSQYGTTEWRLRLWDVQTGTLRHTFDANTRGGYDARAFSPSGTLLAAVIDARDDSARTTFTYTQVWLWDVESGTRVAVLGSQQLGSSANSNRLAALLIGERLGSDSGSLRTTLAFTPDGARIALLAQTGQIAAWGVPLPHAGTAGAGLPPVPEPDWLRADFLGGVTGVAVSSDGGTLYASSGGRVVHAWDLPSGAASEHLTSSRGGVSTLVAGPDGLLLGMSRSDPYAIQMWDSATGTLAGLFVSNSSALSYSAISTDGTQLATSSGGGTITVWRVQDSATGSVLLAPHQVSALAFSPDGSRLVAGGTDGAITAWDLASGEQTTSFSAHSGAVTHLAFRSDGTLVSASLPAQTLEPDGFGDALSGDPAGYAVSGWDLETAAQLAHVTLERSTIARFAALSRDGSRIALLDAQNAALFLWDATSGTLVTETEFSADGDEVTALALDAGGTRIATGHADGSVTLWTTVTGE